MFRMPRDSVMTKMMGRPSGTMATKMAMATMNCWTTTSFKSMLGLPYETNKFSETSKTATMSAMKPRNLPRLSSLSSRGVFGVWASAILLAILPSSVCMPVATTKPNPRPEETVVPMKAMFFRSASTVSLGSAWISLLMVKDSPVNADSSTLHC